MAFLTDQQTSQVEQAVSRQLGRHWHASQRTDLRDLASHPAGILSDGTDAVFVKLSGAANAQDQFACELGALRLLSERSGAQTPKAIDVIAVDGGTMLILEAVQAVERTPHHWREIGRTLARIHAIHGHQFGLATNGYFGPLYQDNRPLRANDWPAFYAERRVWPRLMGAIDAGHIPSDLIRLIERLIQRLPELCGPTVKPTLLHGDAQKNNFISTDAGTVVIDPAPYYGHPEIDLAYMDYFEPVPEYVFDGYRDIRPIDPDFATRRDLWRIYGYLAIVTIDGSPKYLRWLFEAVRKYV